MSSFDHDQKYGLSAPIKALARIEQELEVKCEKDASLNHMTGDLHSSFEGDVELQVFNFTRNEVWETHFSTEPGNTQPLPCEATCQPLFGGWSAIRTFG